MADKRISHGGRFEVNAVNYGVVRASWRGNKPPVDVTDTEDAGQESTGTGIETLEFEVTIVWNEASPISGTFYPGSTHTNVKLYGKKTGVAFVANTCVINEVEALLGPMNEPFTYRIKGRKNSSTAPTYPS